MKKTFISLLALAGMASAAVEGNWTANFTTSNKSNEQTYKDYTASFPAEGCPLTITFTGMTLNNTGKDQANGSYSTTTPGSNNPTAIRPNVNVGNGGSYTLNFTITSKSDDVLTIEAITLNTFLYNSGGNSHDSTEAPSINYALTLPSKTVVESQTYNSGSVTWQSPVDFDLGSGSITLNKKGDFVALSVKVTEGTSNGTFVGLSGATFSVIPEPTTATLSLLALCGLAARRRRK